MNVYTYSKHTYITTYNHINIYEITVKIYTKILPECFISEIGLWVTVFCILLISLYFQFYTVYLYYCTTLK